MKRLKRRVLIFLITILLLFGTCYLYFAVRLKPLLADLADKQARVLAQEAVNEATAVLENADDLLECTYNEQGKLTLISCSASKLNELRRAFSDRIIEVLREARYTEIEIPLGTVLGGALLSGHGPGITVRLLPVSAAEVDLEQSFQSGGINQTLFCVNARVCLRVRLLLPFGEGREENLELTCPLVQTVLSGEVPEVYYAS